MNDLLRAAEARAAELTREGSPDGRTIKELLDYIAWLMEGGGR